MYESEENFFKCAREDNIKHLLPQEIRDKAFEFSGTSYQLHRRFVELLHPAANHFFRKTSKHNYRQCFDLRGIEVGWLNTDEIRGGHGTMCFGTGRLYLNVNFVRKEWTKYLVVFNQFWINNGYEKVDRLNFVKKYESLCFPHALDRHLKYYVHAKLKKFTVWKQHIEHGVLAGCLKKLDVCENLEHLHIDLSSKLDAATLKNWETSFKAFYQRHKHSLKRCSFHCEEAELMSSDNKVYFRPIFKNFVRR